MENIFNNLTIFMAVEKNEKLKQLIEDIILKLNESSDEYLRNLALAIEKDFNNIDNI